MQKPLPRFSTQHVLSANTEILRSLITLLLGKGLVSPDEVKLMASFAKQQIMKHPSSLEPDFGKQASAYVDVLLRSFEFAKIPGSPSAKPQ